MKRKFYVVWNGFSPGIYDSWEECKQQTDGFPGAKYKSFDSQDEATEAFRGDYRDHIGVISAIAAHRHQSVNYAANPDIVRNSVAVDAACSRNPGPVEYRCVDVMTGAELFHIGPLEDGTNNIGEFLALVHALAHFEKVGMPEVTIYSDSRTAMAWVRNRHARTKLQPTPANATIRMLLERAENWLATHTPRNPVLKWDTEHWGEIPADFGRK